MNFTQIVFRAVFRRFGCMFPGSVDFHSDGFSARSHCPPIGLDAECGPHFDHALAYAVDLLLFFCSRLYLIRQALLLRFEFLNPVLQAVDPFSSLIEELFIEQELGLELVLRRELLL